MKLTNARIGWSVIGKFITHIEAGRVPTNAELLAYWHLKPDDARFAQHAKPSRYTHAVLLKHNGNFVVVPLTPDISEVVA